MTDDEAERLLKRIIDTWPTANWSAGTSAIWRKELRQCERTITGPDGVIHEVAKRAYDALKNTLGSRTPPAPADWHERYRAATPRPDWQPPLDDATDPPVTTERALEHIRAIRAARHTKGTA